MKINRARSQQKKTNTDTFRNQFSSMRISNKDGQGPHRRNTTRGLVLRDPNRYEIFLSFFLKLLHIYFFIFRQTSMDPNLTRPNISILQAIQNSQQYSSAPQTPLTGELKANIFSSSPRSLEDQHRASPSYGDDSKVSTIFKQSGFHSPTLSDFNKQLNFPSPNLS